jgi:hypothetical protein
VPLAILTSPLEASAGNFSYLETDGIATPKRSSLKRPAADDCHKQHKSDMEMAAMNQLMDNLAGENNISRRSAHFLELDEDPYLVIKSEKGNSSESLFKKYAGTIALQFLSSRRDKSFLMQRFDELRGIGWSIYKLSEDVGHRRGLINLFVSLEYALYCYECPEAISRESLIIYCYYIQARIKEDSGMLEPSYRFYESSARKILKMCDAHWTELTSTENAAVEALRILVPVV